MKLLNLPLTFIKFPTKIIIFYFIYCLTVQLFISQVSQELLKLTFTSRYTLSSLNCHSMMAQSSFEYSKLRINKNHYFLYYKLDIKVV